MKRSLSLSNYSYVKNAASDSADIYIDGYIMDEPTREFYAEFYGDETSVSFKSVRQQILNSGAKTINIYINSGGGQVTDAMAIHDLIVQLENKGTTINTIGMGIIASAATYILMSSRNSSITENSWVMIHNMSGGVYGDVNEVESYAKMMRKFNDAACNLYATATGKSVTAIGNMMNAETWMTGREACDNGFVKNCSGKAEFKNSIKPEQWPFSNMAVLNTYNSSVSNNKITDMDFKALGEKIANSIKAAMGNTTLTADQRDTAITNALSEGFKEVDTAVSNSVKTAMNSDATATAVANAITEAFKTIPANFTKAITDATSGFATKAELETLQTDLANKLGGQNSGKGGKAGNANEPEAIENKSGWTWGE